VKAVAKLSPTLPHLKPLLVRFFTGALQTWERFTSEFAEGGLIDKATPEQRERAWMPTTNDHSEGNLGQLRLYTRKKSNWALHIYNALKMYQQNNTKAFLAKHNTPDMMQYIRTLARQRDSSKLEQHRRHQLAENADKVVEAKRKKQQNKENKARDKAQQIEKLPWVETDSEVDDMTVVAIKMQLEKYRLRTADIPKKSELNKLKKPGLVTFLKNIISQHKLTLLDDFNREQLEQPISHPVVQASQQIAEASHLLLVEDLTVIDGLLLPQLKAQLEIYRPHTDNVPKKAEINRMRKPALIDLLKGVAAQYKASQAGDLVRNMQPTVQVGGSIISDQGPARMVDLSKIRSTKTTKTVLKAQLELYRQLVPSMPMSDQLEGMKKAELVNLLVDAVNHYTSSQSGEHAEDI
jgi:hypothetical protein